MQVQERVTRTVVKQETQLSQAGRAPGLYLSVVSFNVQYLERISSLSRIISYFGFKFTSAFK